MESYHVRRLMPGDEHQVIAILSRTLPRWAGYGDRLAVWRWKHILNPFGPSTVHVATIDGRIVSTASLLNWRFERNGQTFHVGRSVDLATHPDFRGRGLASKFAPLNVQAATELNAPFIFHTPNEHSARLVERSGPVFVDDFRSQVCVRRVLPTLKAWWRSRRKDGVHGAIEAENAFRARPVSMAGWMGANRSKIEDLIAHDRLRDPDRLQTARTYDYLHWRYAAHPEVGYMVTSAGWANGLYGCLIYRVEDFYSARRLVIEDLLLRRDDRDVLRALRSELYRVVDPDIVQCRLAPACARALAGWPTQHSRRGFRVLIRVLDEARSEPATKSANWRLGLGDLREI